MLVDRSQRLFKSTEKLLKIMNIKTLRVIIPSASDNPEDLIKANIANTKVVIDRIIEYVNNNNFI